MLQLWGRSLTEPEAICPVSACVQRKPPLSTRSTVGVVGVETGLPSLGCSCPDSGRSAGTHIGLCEFRVLFLRLLQSVGRSNQLQDCEIVSPDQKVVSLL